LYLAYPGIFLELGLNLVLVTDELLQGPLDYNARLLKPNLNNQLPPAVANSIALPPWASRTSAGDVVNPLSPPRALTSITF